MSVRNLEHLFQPRSIAVVGASTTPNTVGATVMKNLLQGGFAGPIMPVNPNHDAVAGVLGYPDVAALPKTPDLAVICTPPATVPGLIDELGARGTKAAIVLTAGLGGPTDEHGASLQDAMLAAAKPHLLRILGPNCVGLIVPGIGLNASFAHAAAAPGRIAFVSQSGGLATSVLDWAGSQGIGFSHFVSLGNAADVDFGDVLDYLASDATTRSVLLYMESVKHARKFMSAARAAARNKPVIVVKAGRQAEGARAAASHTGALAGSDAVFDAAIRRAGMLRVHAIADLFGAVETLGRAPPLSGDRLTIMTNGGGPGVMATDALIEAGGRLAMLSPATCERLGSVLPATWSGANPVDIIGDAPVERYLAALKILIDEPGSDALLLIHSPTAIVASDRIADALAPLIRQSGRPVLTCWLGGDAVARARRAFGEAGIPTYDTPEDAVAAFMNMVDYRRNQETLMETPPSVPADFAPDSAAAKTLIARALAAGGGLLTEPEAKEVLAAYGIPVVETRTADSPEAAARLASEMGFPVALKVLSPDITHKSDVGGVILDLASAAEVESAGRAMAHRLAALRPAARLEGFTVQAMARRPGAQELIVGASVDPIFGPVILFGQGGTAVEIVADRAIGLPPLNMALARELVSRTRVSRLLAGYRDTPAANLEAIYGAIVRLSQLVSDLAEIAELDVNPLLADADGVLALDARLRVAPAQGEGPARLAIRPFPRELEERMTFDGAPLVLRPIRPEDEPAHRVLFSRLRDEDIRFRFFGLLRLPQHSELARFTQIDYEREMAFIATRSDADGAPETLGVARVATGSEAIAAEFAIVVRSDMKGKGLGTVLLQKTIDYCRGRGLDEIVGHVLPENRRMLKLAEKLGFTRKNQLQDGVVEVHLKLRPAKAAALVGANGK